MKSEGQKIMTPEKFKYLREKMKNKRYLYNVHFDKGSGQGIILADNDAEAKEFAIESFGNKVLYIQIDDWGLGPKIFLK